jgi:polygalacturonase
MNIFKWMGEVIDYLSEGATALFSPNRDQYPNIGVQPFNGDPYSEWVSNSDHETK